MGLSTEGQPKMDPSTTRQDLPAYISASQLGNDVTDYVLGWIDSEPDKLELDSMARWLVGWLAGR